MEVKTRMYYRGYLIATAGFSYIPDFKNDKEVFDFSEGLKAGYKECEERTTLAKLAMTENEVAI
jgi:hypothetical protein